MPYIDKDKKNANARDQWRRKKEQKILELGLDPSLLSDGRINLVPRKDSSLPAELILEMLPRAGESKKDHLKRRNRLRANYYNSLLTPEERRIRNEKAKAAYHRDHEKVRTARNAAYAEDPGRFRQYNLKYFVKNKETRLAKLALWAEKNSERVREARCRWAKENPEVFLASVAKCRATLLQAAPEWADWGEIRRIYSKSANHNRRHPDDPWQVDHIIPLNNPDVCGLHVPWNLRIIPKKDNQKKGNRWLQEEGLAPMQED